MRAAGFTLLEVLVALFVAAVALTAAGKAVGVATDGEAAARERTLALWLAKNRVAERQSDPLPPELGTREGRAVQAGLELRWREEISATPNPRFRLVRVAVARPEAPDYALAQLTAYLVRR